MKPFVLGLNLSLAVFASSCADSTELEVYVDTDLRPGEEVIAFGVSASVDGFADTHRFEVSADTPLPLTFSVGRSGAVDDDVHLHITALDEDGYPVVTWLAVTRFRDGRSLEIPAALARACAGRGDDLCDAGMVCRNGACEALFIDPRELEPSGTHEGRIFDGPSEPMVAPTCEDRAAGGEACRPPCPCVDRLTCVTGSLTCTPVTGTVEEGCTDAASMPFEGSTSEQHEAFESMCRELRGALCQSEGRECP